MTELYWLEQTEADVPSHDHWLSATELSRLCAFRFPKRRADWRLGRWTAKIAACAYLRLQRNDALLATIETRPEASGAPVLFVANERASVSISLSHCNRTAFCALGPADARLGCDLERIEARSDSFAADFFTSEEYAAAIAAPPTERSRLVTLIWSAKESALKVLQQGLRLDTRSVQVVSPDALHSCTVDRWHPLLVQTATPVVFHGWWQFAGEFVKTVLAAPAPLSPVALAPDLTSDCDRLIA